MTTATVRFVYGLTSVEPGASILRTDWNTIGNGPYTCKIKRYDLENPTQVYNKLCRSGVLGVTLKLYEGGRHELFNDKCKEESFDDILNFLEKVR